MKSNVGFVYVLKTHIIFILITLENTANYLWELLNDSNLIIRNGDKKKAFHVSLNTLKDPQRKLANEKNLVRYYIFWDVLSLLLQYIYLARKIQNIKTVLTIFLMGNNIFIY